VKRFAALVSILAVLVPASARAAEPARVFYYDTGGAAEFADAIRHGADNWNSRLTTVHLRQWRSGDPRNITVQAGDAWPHADPASLGSGSVYMGRRAVRQGHDPVRIAAHELGHILGLPDRRTGRCADLMAGSSAGPSCTNAYPNAHEAAQVDRLMAR
jgi:snapalysin